MDTSPETGPEELKRSETQTLKALRILRHSMKATVRHVKDFAMLASSGSGHYTLMDARYKGKNPGAPTPMEMLVMAVGGCTAVDVVSILGKMKIGFSDLTVEVDAERGEEDFYDIRKLHCHYTVRGDVPEDKLKKAIELSLQKYCSVSLNLKASKDYTYEILP